MKTPRFTGLGRHDTRYNSVTIVATLAFAAALVIGAQSFAGEAGYRVVLEDLPGADEIEAGNIEAGIKILEDQLDQVEQENSGDLWSTLCAAYIDNLALDQAERACNKAVEINPSYHALNNRGVFRLYKGDLSGAREDFMRVRPPDVEAYLERLKAKNVRLVAASNFDLLDQFLAKQSQAEAKTWRALSSAKVEDLNQ